MNILGISCHYHEAAVSLVRDGKVIAASEEERFTRKKHDAEFPASAIRFCLRQGRIGVRDLDYVVFYEKPMRKFERSLTVSLAYAPWSRSWFVESMRSELTEKLWIKSTIASRLGISPDRVLFVPQHLSHAAASFYPSPFERAAYLTLDAVGEWTTGSWGTAQGNRLYPVAEMRFPHSVGLLYSAFTAFLGFEVNDGEYKVMGLSGYGKPRYVSKVKKTFRQYPDGSLALDLNYFLFHKSTKAMYSDLFAREFSGCDRFDLAASIQHVTEEIILTMMNVLAKKTGETNLVYGGGVALNSVVNGLVTKKTPFKRLFIFPAAGDDGASVGAALYAYHHVLGNKKRYSLKDIFWGEEFTGAEIEEFLKKEDVRYKRYNDYNLYNFVTGELIKGKVIGWFEGRAEFGPRALGHRSILADPIRPAMKDIVNKKIKFREEFRPFAPVVMAEKARVYYEITESNLSPYMLGTFQTKPVGKKIAAATTHVDGTSRIQTVEKDYPGRYRKLLEVFYQKTRRPVLLNTSFNLKGEPIVNSPQDAYKTFMRSRLDVLVLGNFVILK